MDLRAVLEAVAAAIVAVCMFFAGRGCENEANFKRAWSDNEYDQAEIDSQKEDFDSGGAEAKEEAPWEQ